MADYLKQSVGSSPPGQDLQAYGLNGGNAIYESLVGRRGTWADLSPSVNGAYFGALITIPKDAIITTLGFRSGSVGLTMGTTSGQHLWFFLCASDGSSVLIASDDQGAGATWASESPKELGFSGGASWTSPATAAYPVLCLINVGSGGSPLAPKFRGESKSAAAGSGAIVTGQKPLALLGGSSLTALPSSVNLASVSSNVPYCWAR